MVAGGEVAGVVALFSYGFPEAQAAFDAAQCPFVTLSHYEALLSEAVASGYITSEEQSLLADWRQDPVAWSERVGQV